MRNKIMILVQKIWLSICLLTIIISPALGNSELPGKGAKGTQNPAFYLNQLVSVPGYPHITGCSTHYAKKGETLSEISRRYFVSISAIVSLNRINHPDRISINQKILIPPVDYVYAVKGELIQRYLIKPGDTLDGLCQTFGLATWQLNRLNPDLDNRNLYPDRQLFLPPKPEPHFRNSVSKAALVSPISSLIRPVRGLISSRYGPRWGRIHYGIDLAAPTGHPVKAAAAGKVKFAGWRGTYGKLIIINHGKYLTYYGHLSKIFLKPGQSVQQGDIIGQVGATGRAYGSHLHFEVEKSGVKLNPLLYLNK